MSRKYGDRLHSDPMHSGRIWAERHGAPCGLTPPARSYYARNFLPTAGRYLAVCLFPAHPMRARADFVVRGDRFWRRHIGNVSIIHTSGFQVAITVSRARFWSVSLKCRRFAGGAPVPHATCTSPNRLFFSILACLLSALYDGGRLHYTSNVSRIPALAFEIPESQWCV